MKLAIIGTGYVGLVSGVCFADFGHDVVCVDVDAGKIERLERGEIPIFEPGLDTLVRRNIRAGRLSFTTNLATAVADADAVFIAVGTPSRRGDGHADLSYVHAATDQIADAIDGYTVVVTKSTVPVGTGDAIEERLLKKLPRDRFDVVSNPEFLREGAAIDDFKRPDRVVVGIPDDASPRAREVMEAIYRPLNINKTPLVFVDRRTSELIKYAANAFLATKITFINEMADLCEAVGGDVQDVARGIGLDKRIGPKFLHAGPGYGGSCFPKDTLALTKTASDSGVELSIVDAVVGANSSRKSRMADKVIRACGGSVEGLTVGVLGLSFKPNTDDMRDAPSLTVIPRLQEAGATVRAHDPEAAEEAAKYLEGVEFVASPSDAARDADALVLVTEWDEYRGLDLKALFQTMRGNVLVDLRNVYTAAEAEAAGLRYTGVGKPS